jgi:hypothetical protein
LAAVAQERDEAEGTDTRFVNWQWMADIDLPKQEPGRYNAFIVPPEVFGKSQTDLADLRIGDASGNRVPYALRVLRTESKQQTVPIRRQFDAGPGPGGHEYQVSLELEDVAPPGYNEIIIDTPGSNFRRKVEVFGDNSDQFKDPRSLLPPLGKEKDRYLVHFETESGIVDVRRFHFDYMQFRFLRVRVFADPTTGEDVPRITGVTVRRAVSVKGTYITRPAALGPAEFLRAQGSPGTAWYIDLGDTVPCERLTFQVNGQQVDRPMRLYIANPDSPQQDLGKVNWEWRKDGPATVLEGSFPEVIARRLRLVVTDYANEPLPLTSVQYTSCARQIVFALPADKGFVPPLGLYFGNPKVGAPHYDFEQRLPEPITPPPVDAAVGPVNPNPNYQPPPQSLSERMPWLVYLLLGLACLVLFGILTLLARRALARADAATEAPAA